MEERKMAKVTDLEVLKNAVISQLAMLDCYLIDLIGQDCAVWCVMGIYLFNDETFGYGQGFKPKEPSEVFGYVDKVSVISYRNGVSVIIGNVASKYQDNVDLCDYEDLEEDIHAIIMYVDTAIERINARP